MGNSQQKLEESLVNLEKTEEDESGEAERPTFTCEICIEPMPSVEKFNNSDRCLHPFCTDCLAKYIRAKVEDNAANIKCPALNCNQLLDPLACQTIISVELFNKWCDCLCNASLLVLHRCYCPYQNCSVLVINECGEAVEKSKCPNCKRLFCFKCKVPWHAGFWCTETQQRRDADDEAFGVLVEENKWTRCPYCGQAVERTTGCSSVQCRCGFRFCHNCGGKSYGCVCSIVQELPPHCHWFNYFDSAWRAIISIGILTFVICIYMAVDNLT